MKKTADSSTKQLASAQSELDMMRTALDDARREIDILAEREAD
jgi:hypothetical protein